MPTVEDALSYARAGWPIFPLHTIVEGKCSCRNGSECHSPGKHPRNSHGHNEGTSDEAQITRWWKQWPNSNIGLWCKGLIVVDVDPRNGGDASLEDLFSTKADRYGFETLTALTGGGGHHYIFSAPDEKGYDCKPVPGIEIKSSGGLIVISPSTHISGRQYQWEDDSVPIAPAPKWLLDMLTQPEKSAERPAFTGKPLDLEAFIKKHNIQTKSPKVCRCKFGGYQWDLIGDCPFQPGYAGGNAAIGVTESGATWFGCFCGDHPKKTWADFKALYQPAIKVNGNIPHDYNPEPDDNEPDETPIEYTPWPEPLSEFAFHGPIGRLAKLIEPNTEADISAIVFQALVMVGNVIGRVAHFMAEGTPHFCNEFVGIVGATAKGRKGSSYGQVKSVISPIDPDWANKRTKSGLTSGEGLIFHVRDEIREIKMQKGQMIEVVTDAGEHDKRMLVVEEELSSAIKAMSREGNTLSGVLRQAWDSPVVLAPMTKNNRITASHPHISIIGHITRDELIKCLKAVENTNGGTNRFLWCCAKRSKLLPFGGRTSGPELDKIAQELDCAIGFAQILKAEVTFDAEAAEMWSIVYEQLGEVPPGTIGAILSRAEPHVRRIAMIYAVMDRSHLIRPEHLEAALEIWRYSADSVRWIFGGIDSGETVQSKVAEKISKFIDSKPEGCSRRDICRYMGGKTKPTDVEYHLGQLLSNGKITARREKRTRKEADYYFRA